MSTTLSQESKNGVTLTNQGKTGNSDTWDEATYTWDEAEGTWDVPGAYLTQESKNSLSISNESKN